MRNKPKKVRTLFPGDYFGEIAFIYNSKRSTSVTSTNYTTLGKLSKQHLQELFVTFPFLENEMVQKILKYDDDIKVFLESCLRQIDYLSDIPDETIHEIIYSMNFVKFDKGSKIF